MSALREHEPPIQLRPPVETDAEVLFPLIYQTPVTDTLAWDGPQSLEEFRQALWTRGLQVAAGTAHFFTIVERASGDPVGCCDVRPEEDNNATVGIWIGEHYQGRGYGTAAIGELTRYAFERLNVERLEAFVFLGNWPSRKAFERNGFGLLGTVSGGVIKHGEPVMEWRLGIERETWQEHQPPR